MVEFTEKSHVLSCLELAQIVMKPEEKIDLFSRKDIQMKNAANSITISCMKKLCEYEQTTYAAEIQKTANRKSSGYNGMRTRLTAYRKICIGLRGVTDVQPKDQPLISRVVARAQNVRAPPEAGGTNILSYFGTNNNS